MNQAVAEQFKLATNKGAIITNVGSNSPASQAGLKTSDVIVNVNGTDVATADDVVAVIRSTQVGQKITITYYRGSTKQSADVITIRRPS